MTKAKIINHRQRRIHDTDHRNLPIFVLYLMDIRYCTNGSVKPRKLTISFQFFFFVCTEHDFLLFHLVDSCFGAFFRCYIAFF